MKETSLYKWVNDNLPGHHVRIENAVSSGIFDINTACYGLEYWIECKVRTGNLIKVAGTQYVWGMDRIATGIQNLLFLVGRHGDPLIYLYTAADVLRICDPGYNDGKRHMLVDVTRLEPAAVGKEEIRAWLFNA